MKVKICGIQDENIALETAQAGADYIGLIFHPASKRFVADLSKAQKITQLITRNHSQPVGVFVDHTAEQIKKICKITNISIVQLHGETSRQQLDLLPKNYCRIYVIGLNSLGKFQKNIKILTEHLKQLDPQRDYILFDHRDSGEGKNFDLKNLILQIKKHKINIKSFRCFLAGGVNINNILPIKAFMHENISVINFVGVDISSGVENKSGKKSVNKIKQFIKQSKIS